MVNLQDPTGSHMMSTAPMLFAATVRKTAFCRYGVCRVMPMLYSAQQAAGPTCLLMPSLCNRPDLTWHAASIQGLHQLCTCQRHNITMCCRYGSSIVLRTCVYAGNLNPCTCTCTTTASLGLSTQPPFCSQSCTTTITTSHSQVA